MKILLLGSNGYIGRRFFQEYNRRFDLFAPGQNDLDITNYKELEKTIEEYNPEVIINCAGISEIEICEEHKEKSAQVNFEGVKNIVKIIEPKDIHLIQMSTSLASKITTHYGFHKFMAEKYIVEHLVKYSIFRCDLIYGLNDLFISDLLLSLEDHEIRFIDSLNVRYPLYIRDLLNILVKSIKNPTLFKGIVNLKPSRGYSLYQMAKAIAKLYGYESNNILKDIPTNSLRLPDWNISFTTGTIQTCSLKEGLITNRNELEEIL